MSLNVASITTDNKPRDLVPLCELDKRAQLGFDYIEGDDVFTPRFVKYKGEWYDTQDTQGITCHYASRTGWALRVNEGSPLANWHSIVTDSFFSGVLFRFVDEDQVIVGRYSV